MTNWVHTNYKLSSHWVQIEYTLSTNWVRTFEHKFSWQFTAVGFVRENGRYSFVMMIAGLCSDVYGLVKFGVWFDLF